jgi:hypothetical protein
MSASRPGAGLLSAALGALLVLPLLATACTSAPAEPEPEGLAAVAARIDERMREEGSVSYTTTLSRGELIKTNLAGDWRHTGEGTWTHAVATRELPREDGLGEVVVVPGTVYGRDPDRPGWRAVEQGAPPEDHYWLFSGFGLLTVVDHEFELLDAARQTGTAEETVDGVATTRHDPEADPAALAPVMTDPWRKKLYGEASGKVTGSLWVDGTGLPVRLTYKIEAGDPREYTTTFTDGGEPVEIEAPAESDVDRDERPE